MLIIITPKIAKNGLSLILCHVQNIKYSTVCIKSMNMVTLIDLKEIYGNLLPKPLEVSSFKKFRYQLRVQSIFGCQALTFYYVFHYLEQKLSHCHHEKTRNKVYFDPFIFNLFPKLYDIISLHYRKLT